MRIVPNAGLILVVLAGLLACSSPASRSASRVPNAIGRGRPVQAGEALPVGAPTLVQNFDGQRAWQDVKRLADPQFEGRHTGTAGEEKAAGVIAADFSQAGLQPVGDRQTYLQSFPVQVEELASVPTLDLSGPSGNERRLALRDDFRPVYGGGAGAGEAHGQGFFIGSDQNLSAAEVAGKVLFVSARGSLRDFLAHARDAGAAAVIVPTGEATMIKAEGRAPDPNAIPVAAVSQSGSTALLEGSGHTRDEINADAAAGRSVPSFPLAWTIDFRVDLRAPQTVQAQNVLGRLPGAPGARTIVVGAHYEEIGPDPDGVAFPAANDNASGVSVLLELVRVAGTLPQESRPTVVFASWSGHEEGLYGSRYYIDHPVVPLQDTDLYLNLDTVGQGSGDALDAFASSDAAKQLLQAARDALSSENVTVPVRALDEAAGSSDDETFSQAGVPSLALSWAGIDVGGDRSIHTLKDTPDNVDPDKLTATGRLAAAILSLPPP